MIAEVERLSYGHIASPTFATETSRIEPLPHQRIAVYEHMLTQPRLRFLLADDAGAGKTIMAGLYIRSRDGHGLDARQLRFWQVVLKLPDTDVDAWVARFRSSPWGMRHNASGATDDTR